MEDMMRRAREHERERERALPVASHICEYRPLKNNNNTP